jgi:hypothetical protein
MSARKKIHKEKKPSRLITAAILSVCVGVVCAAVSLASQKVAETSSVPSDPIPGEVYYVKGNISESRGWPARVAAIRAGRPGTYTFIEGDMNAWAKTNLRRTPPAGEGKDLPFVSVTEAPSFRMTEEDRLQVAMRVELPRFLPGRHFVYQSQGVVDDGSFRAKEGWIGRCPLPLVNAWVLSYLGNQLDITDEAVAMREAIAQTSTEVKAGELIVQK